jgi:hypothetical protein
VQYTKPGSEIFKLLDAHEGEEDDEDDDEPHASSDDTKNEPAAESVETKVIPFSFLFCASLNARAETDRQPFCTSDST